MMIQIRIGDLLCCYLDCILLLWVLELGFAISSPVPPSLGPTSSNAKENHGDIVIEDLYIRSNINFRYAITQVSFLAISKSSKTENVTFDFEIGFDSAKSKQNYTSGGFISRAELAVDGIWRKAKMNLLGIALRKFENSRKLSQRRTKNSASLLVLSKNGDLSKFQLILNVPPGKEVNVTLAYEEMVPIKLYGTFVRCEHRISAKPEKLMRVNSFRVMLQIDEYDQPYNTAMISSHKGNPFKFTPILTEDGKMVSLVWAPNHTQILSLRSQSILGELRVTFDLPLDSSDKNVSARDGYFTHFSGSEIWESPNSSASTPIHTIFVLDVSGSMRNENRLQQLKDGMITILNELKQNDWLDIIAFSNKIQEWSPMRPNTSPFPADRRHKNNAIEFVRNLTAAGSTDIYRALKRAVAIVQVVRKILNPTIPSIIFFLTDGEPTSGLTNRSEILVRLKELNKEIKTPIYSLAFGKDADRPLCSDLSAQNWGFARQIFDMRDASLLMTGFYDDISALIHHNITIRNYKQSGNFETYSLGSKKSDHMPFDPKAVIYDISPCQQFYETINRNVEPYDLNQLNELRTLCEKDQMKKIPEGSSFHERLWAFLEAREMTRRFEKQNLKCPERLGKYTGELEPFQVNMTRIAFHYEFVTECTALILQFN